MIENTFIFAPIRTDLIERALETLYKNTPPNFYTIVVDQTPNGLDANLRNRYKNLTYIRTPKTDTHTKGNLGFSKANNLAISLVTTPYFTLANDDVEFIDRRWWWGVMHTFEVVNTATPDRPAMMVCPASVRLPDWSVGRPSGDNFDILPYKTKYSREDYSLLTDSPHYVNEHLTLMPGSVIDGVTFYCPVIDTEKFFEVGMLDEHFFSGGGEDYDYNTRANMANYRCVGTTMSWVWHWWSKSLSAPEAAQLREDLAEPKLNWNNNNEKWGDGFDIWGVKCKLCDNPLRTSKDNATVATCKSHPDQTFQLPPAMVRPL